MQIINDPEKVRQICLEHRCRQSRVYLVPTMGYYHAGHLELMRWARKQADFLVVSLFVNPTQFGPEEDFESYPRDFEQDSQLAKEEGVDLLFAPEAKDIYFKDHFTWVDVQELSTGLCGRSRPGHFRGVCTVVCKLFNLILPQVAVFGQKDYQQLAIIKRMARDLNLAVEVVGRPIVRESDGLAMSSRNIYLKPEERRQAAQIYAGLLKAKSWVEQGQRDAEEIKARLKNFYLGHIPAGQIDYLELVNPKSLAQETEVKDSALLAVAVFLGKARLIDNILLEG